LTTTAHAGGLARPNGISARGVGMGGAFTAFADDATAVYFNPAALDAVDPHVMIGGELVVGPRTFTPIADDGTRGPGQSATVVAPVPAIGVVGRFWYDERPSRFTLGAGVWNTFGGKVAFKKTGMPALDATQDAALEAVAGASLRISDKLSVGGAIRFGLGLFSLESTTPDATLSANGVGVAMAWGVLLRPTETTRIGLAWRSPLRITTSGSGTIDVGAGPSRQTLEHPQTWPQQASLGGGWQAGRDVRLAVQLDWTAWSQVRELVVHFPATPSLDVATTYREDWRDNWTVRAGGEYSVSRALAVRGGAYADTAAVPDRTIERQYLDSNKLGLAAGASLNAAGWRFDTAIDLVVPNTRTVPNNTAATMAFPADRNKAPGDYAGTLVTFELAAARRF
jgi:long-chain fatty acid transport protein